MFFYQTDHTVLFLKRIYLPLHIFDTTTHGCNYEKHGKKCHNAAFPFSV